MASKRVFTPVKKRQKDGSQRIKFLNAARNCDFEELQKALKCKAFDVNTPIHSAMTPLM